MTEVADMVEQKKDDWRMRDQNIMNQCFQSHELQRHFLLGNYKAAAEVLFDDAVAKIERDAIRDVPAQQRVYSDDEIAPFKSKYREKLIPSTHLYNFSSVSSASFFFSLVSILTASS